MKIGFSANSDGPGGARSWINTFSNYCKDKGHEIRYGFDLDVDVFCSVANMSTVEELKQLKRHGIKILQRLGAIYLYYDHPSKDLIDNKNKILRELTYYANLIVYQSKFSKEVLFRKIYNGNEPDGEIIYNSTDALTFKPNGNKIDRPLQKIVILAIAYWGTPHTSAKSIDLFLNVAQRFIELDNIEFWLLGSANAQNEALIRSYNLPNITEINLSTPIPYNMMPNYLRAADLVLHLKTNEGCSNLVIECIHTATPLVGLNTGSLPELVGDAALLAECTESIDEFPTVNMDQLINNIITTLTKRDAFKQKMYERAQFFTVEQTYDKYLDLLIKLNKLGV